MQRKRSKGTPDKPSSKGLGKSSLVPAQNEMIALARIIEEEVWGEVGWGNCPPRPPSVYGPDETTIYDLWVESTNLYLSGTVRI
jgi:hypothetical protein